MTGPSEPLARLRAGGKPALARALAAVESAPEAETSLDLLDAAWAGARAHVVGLTGPPGVGKSSLTAALVTAWRKAGRSVGVIAVDPSSARTGGALLGDRIRLALDPEDQGIFVRSMASRGRLGGVADMTAAAMTLMRAVHDIVLIETVGVGQSETEISDLADAVVLAVQPGSGDTLQYMKAGIVEIPDIAVVTKADLGALAERARRDLEAAMRLQGRADEGWASPVIGLSALTGAGIPALLEALVAHRAHLEETGRLEARRAAQAQRWLLRAIRDELGRRSLERAHREVAALVEGRGASPFRRLALIARALGG
jgi:LAO/AO transport system kinase